MGDSAVEPEVACVPLHPPLAVQAVALVEDQVTVDGVPSVTEVGSKVTVTVGAGGAVAVTVALALALPPAPLHVNV